MSKISHVMKECIANWIMGVPLIRNWRISRGRTMSIDNDQAQLILDQFDFFMESIEWACVRDKTVIEIGPGDAIPHGLLFLGVGAKQYVAVDRFLGDVSSISAQDLYRALIESAPERLRRGWQEMGLDPYQYPWSASTESQIKLVTKSIEKADLKETGRGDIIISFNVIEHLSNVTQAFRNMAQMLTPDGLMVHRVDYGPHGAPYKNPLTFLTFSKTVWSLMGSNRGYPNRLRHSSILSALQSSGFHNTHRITRRFNLEDAKSIRTLLSNDFRKLHDEDLQIADAEIYSSLSAYPVLREHGFRLNPEKRLSD